MTVLRFRLLPLLLLLSAVAFGGCPSFDSSIQPIITPKPPPGYVPPLYVKGVKPESDVDPNGLKLEVWRVDPSRYPDSIRLFARVIDRDGNLVQNLAPPYFKGSGDYRAIWNGLTEKVGVDGRTQEIRDFTVREFSDQDGIPYEIALVLDYSGSMTSNVSMLETGATAFVGLKRPQDRIALVKFDREPYLITPLTSASGEITSKFTGKGLEGYGSYTALYSAARLGAEQLASAPSDHPRAIVLFTDGEDNASEISSESLFNYARTNDIPIFVIALGAINRQSLEEIADRTSGKFYQTYTADELRSAFEDIYRSLRNYYLVSYKPPYLAGRHFVELGLTPPRGERRVAATATYDAATGANQDTAVPVIVIRDTVYFEYYKSEILPEQRGAIERMAEQIKSNPRLRIEVRGHTDAQGSEELNAKLSDQRAEAVRAALVEAGADANRLHARGFGFSQPVASNETEEGRRMNRRVTFVVLAR